MLHGDVVYKLLDKDCFADACAAEQTDLAALCVGLKKVDDLDAGLKYLGCGLLLVKGRGTAVDIPALRVLRDFALAVDGTAKNVEHSAERDLAHGHLNAVAESLDLKAAGQTVAAGHHNAADGVAGKVLLDLHGIGAALRGEGQGFVNGGQLALGEPNIDHRPGDLCNNAVLHD